MKVYRARYEDVFPIVAFCKKFHATSGWERVPMDIDVLRKNIVTVVRTMGYDVLVAKDDEGRVQGILIATTDRMIFGKTRYATDAHFVANKGGLQLLREFERWSREQDAACIIMSIATADPEGRIEKFYELAGFERIGTAFVKWLEEQDVVYQESTQ